jgi:Icc-related predicted phosphoesterase
MKILIISDVESSILYKRFDNSTHADVDIVISCGDLRLDYLEYIVTMFNVPCYYVPGNHDERFLEMAPPGWEPLDDRIASYKGVKILGLGGSMRYKPGPFQYTELEMKFRLLRLIPSLWLHKNRIDILVTHAPAYKLGDLEGPHRGFKVFRTIIEKYKPRYHLHGHVHLNYSQYSRKIKHGQTSIINAFDHYMFEY